MAHYSTRITLTVTGIFILILFGLGFLLKPEQKHGGTSATPSLVPVALNQRATLPNSPVRIADLPETTEIPAERDRHQILKNCRLLTAPTNDGDSFWMTTPKGTFRFDLYYADCPDLVDGYSATTQEHLQHFQGLDESALREAASAALNYVQLAAKDRSFDVITRWEQVQNIPGPFTPTFKAFVMMETSKRHYESLATYLVKNGFARTEPNCKEPLPSLQPVNEYVQLLVEHQNRAKAEFKGAWQKVPRIHQTGMTR